MMLLDYIMLAVALAVPTLVIVRGCVLQNPIRLTRGLCVSFVVAAVHTAFLLSGMQLGNEVLRFGIADYDNLICLGLLVVVAGRMFFMAFSKKERPSYDIARWSTVLLLGVATGVNALFVGLGVGFVADLEGNVLKVGIPSIVVISFAVYLGIMLGRRKKSVRARRWLLLGMLFLLIIGARVLFQ